MRDKPIHILHVVGGMKRGGVETWLVSVLRNIDRGRFQMDFLVHTTQKCAYDDEIRELGSRIISCMHPSYPWTYVRNFRRILQEYGPYDVVHSHVYLFSGVVLYLARHQGITARIAHIYPTEDWQARTRWGWVRTGYRWLMAQSICKNATQVLFDSRQAKDAFARLAGGSLPTFRVLYCGIDLAPFRSTVSADAVRAELDIPSDDTKVVITVARYVPRKNHRHLIEMARRVAAVRDDVVFLLVGDGPLHSEIQHLVRDVGLTDRFRFVRRRPRITSLYQSADLLLFPSLMEGFGLVVVEAAAAGLPIVASRIPGIVDAAQASPSATLIEPDDTEGFVRAVLDCLAHPKARYVLDWSLLEPFDILTSCEALADIYTGKGRDS